MTFIISSAVVKPMYRQLSERGFAEQSVVDETLWISQTTTSDHWTFVSVTYHGLTRKKWTSRCCFCTLEMDSQLLNKLLNALVVQFFMSKLNHLWPRYLAWWFTLTLSRSRLGLGLVLKWSAWPHWGLCSFHILLLCVFSRPYCVSFFAQTNEFCYQRLVFSIR